MCGQRDNGYWIETFVHFIRTNKFGSLHAAHERHGYVHLRKKVNIRHLPSMQRRTHKNDIERLSLRYAPLERVHRKAPVLRDLHGVSVLLQDLHREFLVDQVVLRKQDVERDIIWCGDWADGIRLQSRNERSREVLSSDRSSHLRADALVQAPLH